jgi:hypothetical protein
LKYNELSDANIFNLIEAIEIGNLHILFYKHSSNMSLGLQFKLSVLIYALLRY